MKNSDSMSIIYRTGSVSMSLMVSLIITLVLSWPVTAEISLSICIFIQLMAFARYMHNYLQGSESMAEVFAYLKEGAADSHSHSN